MSSTSLDSKEKLDSFYSPVSAQDIPTIETVHIVEQSIEIHEKTAGGGSYEITLKELQIELEEIYRLRVSVSPSGYLGNLSFEQQRKLINLWGMLIEYLQRPYDQKAASRKDKQLVAMLYQQSLETASSTSSLVESDKSAVSSGRSSAIQANPLSIEFWSQAAFGDMDTFLLRFLRARKWDINEAFSMLKDTLEWRKMYNVRQVIAEGEMGVKKELLTSGKSFFWNVDHQGRLISVVTGRLHDKSAQTIEETCRLTVYLMELGRRLMQPPSEMVTLVFDMADAGISSFDLSSIQFMVQCFQNFYPESLGKCLIVNPPWIFSGFFRMVKPLLDPIVAAKIEMVSPGEEMFQFIPQENLMKRFGGSSEYEYKFEEAEEIEMIAPISDNELLKIELELADLQTRLIDTTISLNSLFLNASEIGLQEDDPTITALMELRDSLKRDFTAHWAIIDGNSTPKNMYHRLGILSPSGKVSWNAWKPKSSTDEENDNN